MKTKNIACLGVGAMGSAIMQAICKTQNPEFVTVTDKNTKAAIEFSEKNGCKFAQTNKEAVKDSNIVFIAVKPQFLKEVFQDIKDVISTDTIVVSMAAGITIAKLERFAPGIRFIRMMPNVCAKVSQAMTALTCGQDIKEEELETVKEILSSSGRVEIVPENLMDCVTAVSGSGPAFVFMFIEALADAAVKCGMPRKQAYIYAAQTVKGAAQMTLEDGRIPAELKDSVCSPGGTTIEGVAALEKNGFRNSIIEAVSAACEKSVLLDK